MVKKNDIYSGLGGVEGGFVESSLMRTEDDENNEGTQKQKDEQNQAEEVGKVEKKEGQVEVKENNDSYASTYTKEKEIDTNKITISSKTKQKIEGDDGKMFLEFAKSGNLPG